MGSAVKQRSKDKFRDAKMKKRVRVNHKLNKAISPNTKKRFSRDKVSKVSSATLQELVSEVRQGGSVAHVAPVATAGTLSDALDAHSLMALLCKKDDTTGRLEFKQPEPLPVVEPVKAAAKKKRPAPKPSDAPASTDAPAEENAEEVDDDAAEEVLAGVAAVVDKKTKGAVELPFSTNANQYERKGPNYVFWERSGLHPSLVSSLKAIKFTHPTPIQQDVLPAVLQRHLQKDVVVSAETGSGKTLVFVLPVLHSILSGFASNATVFVPSKRREKQLKRQMLTGAKRPRAVAEAELAAESAPEGDVAEEPAEVDAVETTAGTADAVNPLLDYPGRVLHSLVVTPTRELATQIERCFSQLVKSAKDAKGIRVTNLVGGMAPAKQQRLLNKKPHVLICTPGRIWDLVCKNEGCYLGHSISARLTYLVLDEADRLLQGGRFEELKKILERVTCQVLPSTGLQHEAGGGAVEELADEKEALIAGTWDPVKNKFIPFSKSKAPVVPPLEPEVEGDKTAPILGNALKQIEETKKKAAEAAKKKKKSKKGKAVEEEESSSEEEEEEESDKEGGDVEDDNGAMAKDRPQHMMFPPPPLKTHRVVSIITSATLSLECNYSKKNRRTQQFIRTTNIDTLTGVLNALGIKPHRCLQFEMKPQGLAALTAAENGGSTGSKVAARLHETYLRCPENTKELYLYYFLKTFKERTIVFVNAISMLRRLAKILEILGIPCCSLHASMQQRQRLKYIDKFRSGERPVLIATDVAARGLDVEGVRYIIHYQVPRSTDAYIHRCGRTARCGGSGFSSLFVSPDEFTAFKKLLESMGRKSPADMEVLAVDQTVLKQLLPHHRMALQIDDLARQSAKGIASQRWVKQTSEAAEVDADDMRDEEAETEFKRKLKLVQTLRRRLGAMIRLSDTTIIGAGKGAFPSAARAMGAVEAVESTRERADRQMYRNVAPVDRSSKDKKRV